MHSCNVSLLPLLCPLPLVPQGVRNIVVSVSVSVHLSMCLSVCSYISKTTCPNFSKFSVAVTQSYEDDSAISCVLPVL